MNQNTLGDLRVAIVQTSLVWQDIKANRLLLNQKLTGLSDATDLIVLPEMFTTGFSMDTSHAELYPGDTVFWMLEWANKLKSVIMGSLMLNVDGLFRNRLIVAKPNGSHEFYDKRHLFSLAGENEHYTAGQTRLVFEINNWRICPLICYDLRFPVWSRNKNDYDLLIYVANWPSVRSYHWNQLLKARAIENQSYSIGVNRIGQDGNGFEYAGDSQFINPEGNILRNMLNNDEVVVSTLYMESMISYRTKYQFLSDADEFVMI